MEYFTCAPKSITQQDLQIIKLFLMYRRFGRLPTNAGYLDHPHAFIVILDHLDFVMDRLELEERENQRQKK